MTRPRRNHCGFSETLERLADRIYLDHAATTPMLPEAVAAMADGMARWANPSSPHAEGRAARAALEEARGRIAAAYGWSGETILTSGASESLGIALNRSVAERRAISAVEHDLVMRVALDAAVLPVDAAGVIDMAALDEVLALPGRTLVAVQWANSETGGCASRSRGLPRQCSAAGDLLLVDAAQMPVGADADVMAHADFVAISAHKRGGPPGVGGLLVRDVATLLPTGGQERGYRAGTENLPGALGFAAALEVAEEVARLSALRLKLDDAIARSGGEVVARKPASGDRRLSHARARRDDSVDPVRHGRDRSIGGQRLFVGEHEAEPCTGRDGLERGRLARSGAGELRAIDDRGRCRCLHR